MKKCLHVGNKTGTVKEMKRRRKRSEREVKFLPLSTCKQFVCLFNIVKKRKKNENFIFYLWTLHTQENDFERTIVYWSYDAIFCYFFHLLFIGKKKFFSHVENFFLSTKFLMLLREYGRQLNQWWEVNKRGINSNRARM